MFQLKTHINAHKQLLQLSPMLTMKSRQAEPPNGEAFNGYQNQVHNAASSAVENKTDSFVFEKIWQCPRAREEEEEEEDHHTSD